MKSNLFHRVVALILLIFLSSGVFSKTHAQEGQLNGDKQIIYEGSKLSVKPKLKKGLKQIGDPETW